MKLNFYAFILQVFVPLFLIFLLPSQVDAQDIVRPPPSARQAEAEQAEQHEEPQPQPPELIEFVQAEYPEEALEAGIEAEVIVRIVINAEGSVDDVEVLEPAGHGFDEAAVAAIRQFRFRPAQLGDQPMAATIRYRYRFHYEEAPEETPDEAESQETIAVRGQITDLDDIPVAGAHVEITRQLDDGTLDSPVQTQTNEQGQFEISEIVAGNYDVLVSAGGFLIHRSTEATPIESGTELTVRLEREGSRYETTVRARRPRQLVTHTVNRREIERIPGSSGDPLVALQNMPGAARTPFGSGGLIIRGAAPWHNTIRLEGVEIPMAYHFGNLTSVVNARLIDDLNLIPGNYPIRYSNAHGGAVEIQIRELQQEPYVGWHGEVSADLIDAQLQVEGPILPGLSFAAAIRRSYLEAYSKLLFGDMPVTIAPVYWDYQAILQWAPNSRHFLRLIAFGSDDRMEFIVNDPGDTDRAFSGRVTDADTFHGGLLQYRYRPQKSVSFDITSAVTWDRELDSAGQISHVDLKFLKGIFRPELTLRPAEWGRFTFGSEVTLMQAEAIAKTIHFDYVDQCDLPTLETHYGPEFHPHVAAYVDAEFRPIPQLKITSALRVEYFDEIESVAIEPRFWLRYQIREGTELESSVGVFHQTPDLEHISEVFGNPEIGLERSIQASAGVNQRLWGPLSISATGFFRWMDQRAVSSDRLVERNGEQVPIFSENIGLGRSYGLELLLRHEPTDRFFGWISYTLMRSERQDGRDEPWHDFFYDQTHNLTIVAGVNIARGWEVSARFRLTSGMPTTPVHYGLYNAGCDSYQGVSGTEGSARMPLYHQLDLRIDKTWTIRNLVDIGVYIDIQNVYYNANIEFYYYNYNYSRRYELTGLPIIPSIGLKVEL